MQSNKLTLECTFEQWPDQWNELLKSLSDYEKDDKHFWKNLVRSKLSSATLSEEDDAEYKAFFEAFWVNVRPQLTRNPEGFIVATDNGLDVYIKNWLQGLNEVEINKLIHYHQPNGDTALHLAAKYGDVVIAKILLEQGADINASGFFNQTPLHYAAYENHADMIEYLLNMEADAYKKRNDGEMPIHVAAEMGRVEAVNVFIQHDPKQIKSCAKEARTALYIAAMNGKTSVMQALLQQGDDINQFNPYYRHNIMHMAAIKNNPKIIAFLATNHANIDILDGSKRTPLQCAAMQKRPSYNAAAALIEAGANVNAGNPPPYYLLANNVGENIKLGQNFADLLIEHGAVINPKHYWETPFDPVTTNYQSHTK